MSLISYTYTEVLEKTLPQLRQIRFSLDAGKILNFIITYMCKGKAVPLQAWSGPSGSRKLRFPDFMTTAQDGGTVVSTTHRPPLPQEIHLVLISVRD